MDKDFEWLKWLGFFVVVILFAVFIYLKKNNEPLISQNDSFALQIVSLKQTEKFIERIEQLQANDSSINLDHTPDVAQQSRKYNILVEEAERIYGVIDISNEFRYCTMVASYARELWSLKYSPSNMTKEYTNKSKKKFLEAYEDAKKGCLEQVKENQN